MNLKRTLLMAVSALMTTAGMVSAGVNTYSLTATGPWNNAGTWTRTAFTDPLDPDTYPDSDDIANVNGAFIVTVDSNAAAGQLNITNASAKVVIDNLYELAVNSSASWTNGQFEINGGKFVINSGVVFTVPSGKTLVMKGTSPVLEINQADGFRLGASDSKLQVQSDAIIQGSGSFRGDNSAADVEIDVTGGNVQLTLASGTTMHGGMEIQKGGTDNGSATFRNEGLLKADNSLTITLGDALDAVNDSGDCSAVLWEVASGAIMVFDVAANLNTSFTINGTFTCNGAVHTEGYASGCINHNDCAP